MKKIISIIISIIIISLLLALFIMPKKEFSYNENRYLSKFPKLTLDSFISGKYMKNIESYISDNFPLRESLLGLKSNIYKIVGVYKQNDVYYGKDHKLYQEYKEPLNNDIIIKRVNNLRNNTDTNISFMLVPTSIYVYQDNISKYNNSYDENKTIEYLKSYLDVYFIDVREALNKNKDKYIFYGTDHHWTTEGAYVAYQEYCKKMNISCNNYSFKKVSDKFYGTLYSKVLDNTLDYDYIEIIEDNTSYNVHYVDNNKITDSFYNYDYLEKKDKYSFFLDNNHSLIEIENLDTTSNDSLLVIKDSYANAFIPLIASNYKYVYVIDPRYYSDSISDYINSNNIDNVLFLYNVITMADDLGIVSIK